RGYFRPCEEVPPSLACRRSTIPGARVREVERHLSLARFAQPVQLFRRGADAAIADQPLEELDPTLDAENLIESLVDGLGERRRAQNLLRTLGLLAVNDHRGLVRFGYLLRHP